MAPTKSGPQVLTLDLYGPKAGCSESRPAVVLVPGDGFRPGELHGLTWPRLAAGMVELGYSALTLNYRTTADRRQPAERFRRMVDRAPATKNWSEAEIIALTSASEDTNTALRWLERTPGPIASTRNELPCGAVPPAPAPRYSTPTPWRPPAAPAGSASRNRPVGPATDHRNPGAGRTTAPARSRSTGPGDPGGKDPGPGTTVPDGGNAGAKHHPGGSRTRVWRARQPPVAENRRRPDTAGPDTRLSLQPGAEPRRGGEPRPSLKRADPGGGKTLHRAPSRSRKRRVPTNGLNNGDCSYDSLSTRNPGHPADPELGGTGSGFRPT